MADEDAAVVVEVDPQPEGEGSGDVVVNEGDTTVIVEPEEQEDSGELDMAFVLGGVLERVAALESRLPAVEVQAAVAQDTADVALEEAVVAEDTAEAVGEFTEEVADAAANPGDEDEREDIAEEVETSDGILPTKRHWVHRSFKEWVGGDR